MLLNSLCDVKSHHVEIQDSRPQILVHDHSFRYKLCAKIENMQLSNLARLTQSGGYRFSFQLDYKYGKRANFREKVKKYRRKKTPRVLVVFTGTGCFAFGLWFFFWFFFQKKKVHLHESLLQVHNPMQNLIFRDLNVPFSFFHFFLLFFWFSETGF